MFMKYDLRAYLTANDLEQFLYFHRAMPCIRGTSHDPVSVCPSVTSRSSTKMAKRRIVQTAPHDSQLL